MNYEATGKIIEKFSEQQITEKFRKREFVVEISDGLYPQQIKFELTQDKCAALDNFSIGDEIKVSFNLRGRSYDKDGKKNYFTTIQAWRLDKVSSNSPSYNHDDGGYQNSSPRQSTGNYPAQPSYNEAFDKHNANDDIPF
jgi:single-strand DNA-binding protein